MTGSHPATDAFRKDPSHQPWECERCGRFKSFRNWFSPLPKLDEREPASLTEVPSHLNPRIAPLLLKEAEDLSAARLDQAWRAEARATTLQAAAGIAIGLAFTGAAFLIDPDKVADQFWRVAFSVVLALVLCCLGMAGYLASRATARGLAYCVPTPEDIRKRSSMTELVASRDRAVQLLEHYKCNYYFSHFKIEHVKFAGYWFRAGLGWFAALSILLLIYTAVGPVPQ
jgi:hypothetical protein